MLPSPSFVSVLVLSAGAAIAAPEPVSVKREIQRRALSDILNSLADGISVNDITQAILPSYFANIPSVDEITDKLGVSASDFSDAPLEVLNIPGYANWTGNDWNLRFHAQAYKEPLGPDGDNGVIDQTVLDQAAEGFIPDFDIGELQPNEQENARNLTSAILSIPIGGEQLEFLLKVAPENANNGTNEQISDWTARVIWPSETNAMGEIDGFIPIPVVPAGADTDTPWLPDGDSTSQITTLDVYTNGTDTGNATAYLVPPDGFIILSDIDDILRVTKIYQPTEGLLNTFARDFTPWLNMPEVYAEWSQQHPDRPYHFHYLTTTPQPAARKYMDFIYTHYPQGSFDTRSMNFSTVDQVFSSREVLLNKIFQTFPRRRFILVGDTTNPDVMTDYPLMAKTYGNVHCILMRNTSATDSENKFPYDTSGFRGLNTSSYMFFNTPDDLMGLDFGNGDCVNSSVPQGITYGWQNLPLGMTTGDGNNSGGARERAAVWWMLIVAAATWWMVV